MGDKNDCPICFKTVDISDPMDCYECMTCHQKIHSLCELQWNHGRIPQADRFLKDDILICPVCKGNSIAFCNDIKTDINEDIKKAVAKNPNRRGGKMSKRKSYKMKSKLKKSRKPRKSRKTRKSRKPRKSRKTRKSRKSRK